MQAAASGNAYVPNMVAASGPSELASELSSSLTALLLGFQRLRELSGGSDRERALALIERMEATARVMAGLLEAIRDNAPPAKHS